MNGKNEKVYILAQDWVRWLDTRRFFGPPQQKNILARLIDEGRASRGEPNADLDAELSAFNLAVAALEPEQFVPFVVVYCDYRPKPVKTLAYECGISRNQFYLRAHAAAGAVGRVTRRLVGARGEVVAAETAEHVVFGKHGCGMGIQLTREGA